MFLLDISWKRSLCVPNTYPRQVLYRHDTTIILRTSIASMGNVSVSVKWNCTFCFTRSIFMKILLALYFYYWRNIALSIHINLQVMSVVSWVLYRLQWRELYVLFGTGCWVRFIRCFWIFLQVKFLVEIRRESQC